jgi:hypothetical protein
MPPAPRRRVVRLSVPLVVVLAAAAVRADMPPEDVHRALERAGGNRAELAFTAALKLSSSARF